MEIGVRLSEERTRLGYSQADICGSCGISKRSYIHYESGDRSPDAEFLGAASKIGMDIQFIVIGIRSANFQSKRHDEEKLLSLFRGCDEQAQVHLVQTATLLSSYNKNSK
jgi:transcriptional regulator with XRE-family HTH domain